MSMERIYDFIVRQPMEKDVVFTKEINDIVYFLQYLD